MAAVHQRIGHRDRADGVIGIERVRVKEGFEDLRAVVTELVHRADDVPDDGAEHLLIRSGCDPVTVQRTRLRE